MERNESNEPARWIAARVLAVLAILLVGLVLLIMIGRPEQTEVAAPDEEPPATSSVDTSPSFETSPTSEGDDREPSGPVLWADGLESGDFSSFYDISTSGCTEHDVVEDLAREGSEAAALTVCKGEGGVRLRVERFEGSGPEGLPDDAFYSVWVNFGEPWEGDDTNFFQFKKAIELPDGTVTKRILMGLYAHPLPETGEFELRLKSKVSEDGVWDDEQRVLADGVLIPADEWIHVEVRYVWDDDPKGRVQVWVDGEEVFDLRRVTDPQRVIHKEEEGGDGEVVPWEHGDDGDQRQWDINHYLDGSRPKVTTIYIDEPAVATERLGPRRSLVVDEG